MRTKLMAAILAGGALLGLQAAAIAQDMNEHPTVTTPGEAKQKPNEAAKYRDEQAAPPNAEEQTGRPVPGPHDSR
jgi:hypothetical protein